MRSDNRREFSAIPIVVFLLGYGALLFLAFRAGLWAWLLLGAVSVVAGVLLVRAYTKRHRHPAAHEAPRRAASAEAAAKDGVHRILVIADDSCTTAAFREELSRHAAGREAEAFVVAPALGSKLARLTGDEGAYKDAQSHLDATVGALGEMGIAAHGHIGSHDPLQAADDGLREFAADEVVFATHPESDTNWLEEGVVEAARSRYDLPVTHIVVTPG